MSDEMRAVLEAVVYGDDPRITPGERMRAAEQLRGLDPPPPARSFEGLLAGLSDAEVAEIHDEFLGVDDAKLLLAGDPNRPVLSAALQEAVEARAKVLAAEMVRTRLPHPLPVLEATQPQAQLPPAPVAPEPEQQPTAVPTEPPAGVVPWPPRRRGRYRAPGGWRD